MNACLSLLRMLARANHPYSDGITSLFQAFEAFLHLEGKVGDTAAASNLSPRPSHAALVPAVGSDPRDLQTSVLSWLPALCTPCFPLPECSPRFSLLIDLFCLQTPTPTILWPLPLGPLSLQAVTPHSTSWNLSHLPVLLLRECLTHAYLPLWTGNSLRAGSVPFAAQALRQGGTSSHLL